MAALNQKAAGTKKQMNMRYKISLQSNVEALPCFTINRATRRFSEAGSPANSDYLQDPFSSAFVYDAGFHGNCPGVRVAYRQKLGDNFDFAAVYAFAGALAPGSEDAAASTSFLR